MEMKKKSHQTGFTLIELMVVVAILAIIAGIALPTYQNYIQTSRNVEGANEIAAIQLAQEEFFLENNTYFGPTTLTDADASNELYGMAAGLWVPGKWDTAKTDLENFQGMNFWFEIDLCPANADVSTCYVVRATGQNEVDPAIVIERQKGQ